MMVWTCTYLQDFLEKSVAERKSLQYTQNVPSRLMLRYFRHVVVYHELRELPFLGLCVVRSLNTKPVSGYVQSWKKCETFLKQKLSL